MQRFEYRVIPAPRRGEKARGVKTTEDRFALALANAMNELGAEGWEYLRADTLPCDERAGLTGTKTTVLNMLVFRRALPEATSPVVAAPVISVARLEPQAAVALRVDDAAALRLGAAGAPAGVAPAVGPAQKED